MTLLQKIEARRDLTLSEWSEGGARVLDRSVADSPSALPAHGEGYLLLSAPDPIALWGGFAQAAREGKTLVVLPPASEREREVFLRQLPDKPPPAARLALFSSGTMGEPKAVLHAEASLLASAGQLRRAFPSPSRACLLPAWSMAGIAFHFLLPLASGGRSFFSKESLLYWAEGADAALARAGVEPFVLTPFQHAAFLRSDTAAWEGATVTLSAPLKERPRSEHRARRKGPLREIYGMTEAAGPVLLDGETLGAELRLGPESELEIRGAQLFLGYSREGGFEARQEWFPTGDRFACAGGKWRFEARARELISIGGRNVPPRLIEEIFEEMPEISECLAFSGEVGGLERPGLVYVRAEGCKLSREELSRRMEKRALESLSEDLRPVWWRELESLPRLPGGKPDRKSLRFSAS